MGKATKEQLWWVEQAPEIYKEMTERYRAEGR
jgi:hypothetical protein